jgi:ribosome recycling factor
MEILLNDLIKEVREKMDKSFSVVVSGFSKLRTGKASPLLLEDITVDAYGQLMPLKQLASISVPDPHSIVVHPWDKTVLEPIDKAIRKSELGLNPQSDGTILRVNIPPLSEERRKEMVKMAKKLAEEGKVAVRSIRRDFIDTLKAKEKSKELSEDIRIKGEKDVQKLTDDEISRIDDVLNKKEQEILTV